MGRWDMGRLKGCTVELSGDIGAVVDTSPAVPSDAVGEAALAALEDLENRRIAGCPQCASAALQRWGRGRSKVQRWRCRDCERSFSSTTGTMLAGLHAPDKLRLVLIDMLSSEPSSCRGLASALSLSAMTIWGWRQRVNEVLERIVTDQHEDIGRQLIEVATVVMRESRKASREWVDHQRDPTRCPEPDRHRWVDYRERHLPLPRPMTPHLLAVQLTEDRFGNSHATLLPELPPRRGTPATSTAIIADQVTPPPVARPVGQHAATGELLRPQEGDALGDRFRAFLRPFSGPAKKHLGGYVAWFVAWHAGSTETRRLHMEGRAWRALTAPRPTQFWT